MKYLSLPSSSSSSVAAVSRFVQYSLIVTSGSQCLLIYHSPQLGSRHCYLAYEAWSFLIITTMETTISNTERPPEPPVRILVQTLTHLVLGNDSYERTMSILNRVCQYHWNCDFSVPKFRWASYNAEFAFNNRRCFFLVDHGESQNDDEVPVICYQWTGETL